MPSTLVEAIVAAIRLTVPFRTLPAMTRPLDELWHAHNSTLLSLRLPLYHNRLHKPRPRPKAYDAAIQAGLAILGAFARAVTTRQAIVRIERGQLAAISFQPRPFAANWNREHALSPGALADAMTDPLTMTGQQPTVSTGDMIHLAGKVAMTVADIASNGVQANGTATFEFGTAPGTQPVVRVVYRPKEASDKQPPHIEVLRYHR